MKKIVSILVLCLFCFEVLNAQTWTTVNASRGNFSFQILNTFAKFDTLSTLLYSANQDSLGIQVHFIDSASVINNDANFTSLISENQGDTLRAIAAFMISLTNGQLVSIQNLGAVGTMPKGLEVGIKFKAELPDNIIMFSRIYRRYNRFYAFTATSIEPDLTRLGNYKNTFFNSINFY